MCDDIIGKTIHCTLFRCGLFLRARREMTKKKRKPRTFFLRDDIKSKFKSHKSFLFLLTGDYLMIKRAKKEWSAEEEQPRIFFKPKIISQCHLVVFFKCAVPGPQKYVSYACLFLCFTMKSRTWDMNLLCLIWRCIKDN